MGESGISAKELLINARGTAFCEFRDVYDHAGSSGVRLGQLLAIYNTARSAEASKAFGLMLGLEAEQETPKKPIASPKAAAEVSASRATSAGKSSPSMGVAVEDQARVFKALCVEVGPNLNNVVN